MAKREKKEAVEQATMEGALPDDGRFYAIQLHAQNVQCLTAVRVDFDGSIHRIAGDEGQGKTSILKAIYAALYGMDPAMVQMGADEAEIVLKLNEATITRIVRREGDDTVFVSDANGLPVNRGIDFLQAVLGKGIFNPVAWAELGAHGGEGHTQRLRQQRNQLLAALRVEYSLEEIRQRIRQMGMPFIDTLKQCNLDGVDFTAHPFDVCQSLESVIYKARAARNVNMESARSRYEVLPRPERKAPGLPVSELQRLAIEARKKATVAEERLSGRKNRVQQRNKLREKLAGTVKPEASRAAAQRTQEEYQSRLIAKQEEIGAIEAQLLALRAEEKEIDAKVKRAEKIVKEIDQYEAMEADLAEMEAGLADAGEPEDVQALEEAAKQAEADVEAQKQQDAIDIAGNELAALQEDTARFTELIKLFRDELPKELLQRSKLPIKGLSLDENMLLINGVPIHQMGTAQRIKIGVVVAAALNPRSGFICVDGAESLGRTGMRALAEAADEMGLQLIMTVVDPDAQPAPGVTVMDEGAALNN